MSNVNRQPKGSPIGGQFAPGSRSESTDIDLDSAPGVQSEEVLFADMTRGRLETDGIERTIYTKVDADFSTWRSGDVTNYLNHIGARDVVITSYGDDSVHATAEVSTRAMIDEPDDEFYNRVSRSNTYDSDTLDAWRREQLNSGTREDAYFDPYVQVGDARELPRLGYDDACSQAAVDHTRDLYVSNDGTGMQINMVMPHSIRADLAEATGEDDYAVANQDAVYRYANARWGGDVDLENDTVTIRQPVTTVDEPAVNRALEKATRSQGRYSDYDTARARKHAGLREYADAVNELDSRGFDRDDMLSRPLGEVLAMRADGSRP